MGDYYIGLISGTSMDGIDAALVEFSGSTLKILQTHAHEYSDAVRQQLAIAMHDSSISSLDDVTELHGQVGQCFRDAANVLLDKASIAAADVTAIGSHGQTVRHEPNLERPFSLQIGDPAIIAAGTGITTIADFRTADIELGGQGAPLAPAFHEWLFRQTGTQRVVVNIGGIGNITVLPAGNGTTTGFDTGPGNTLLDAWIRKILDKPYDRDGNWGASGTVNEQLLGRMLADPYFAADAPKSTGFEYFNLNWLEAFGIEGIEPADIQATLCQLSVCTIADAIKAVTQQECDVLVCGGGAHNAEMMRQLAIALPGFNVQPTSAAGLDPDWVEAVAFAWLAMRNIQGQTGNLPSVTGASQKTILGTSHDAAS